MKILSKATMPLTVELDTEGTIATKSYVDDKVGDLETLLTGLEALLEGI